MKKILFIGVLAVVITACKSTAKLPPMDDAYYWSENSQNSQNIQNTPNPPNIEYLNVQDTTVTIRIKR